MFSSILVVARCHRWFDGSIFSTDPLCSQLPSALTASSGSAFWCLRCILCAECLQVYLKDSGLWAGKSNDRPWFPRNISWRCKLLASLWFSVGSRHSNGGYFGWTAWREIQPRKLCLEPRSHSQYFQKEELYVWYRPGVQTEGISCAQKCSQCRKPIF